MQAFEQTAGSLPHLNSHGWKYGSVCLHCPTTASLFLHIINMLQSNAIGNVVPVG